MKRFYSFNSVYRKENGKPGEGFYQETIDNGDGRHTKRGRWEPEQKEIFKRERDIIKLGEIPFTDKLIKLGELPFTDKMINLREKEMNRIDDTKIQQLERENNYLKHRLRECRSSKIEHFDNTSFPEQSANNFNCDKGKYERYSYGNY